MVVEKNTKFFTGVECEGIYQGLETLFIVGDQMQEQIRSIIHANPHIEQIYFGAQNQSKIYNWETVRSIAKVFPEKFITVEVLLDSNNIPDDILNASRFHKVFTIKYNKHPVNNITLKIENDSGIYCYDRYLFNDYSWYSKDITLNNITTEKELK